MSVSYHRLVMITSLMITVVFFLRTKLVHKIYVAGHAHLTQWRQTLLITTKLIMMIVKLQLLY